MNYTTIKNLEHTIQNIEHFPIILRYSAHTKVQEYAFKKAAPQHWTLKQWEEKRLQGIQQPDKNFDLFKHRHHLPIEIVILLPNGNRATRSMKLKTLRKIYSKQH